MNALTRVSAKKNKTNQFLPKPKTIPILGGLWYRYRDLELGINPFDV